MISDRELAAALLHVKHAEGLLRDELKTDDLTERDSAVVALRLVVPLGRSLQTWISLRALRQQLASGAIQ